MTTFGKPATSTLVKISFSLFVLGMAAHHVTNAASAALSTANASSVIPSSYTYDATSGYYYDSSTSLYYDPNTGYYYNSTTGKWLFWNGSRYQAVNQDGTPVVASVPPAAPVAAPVAPAYTLAPAYTSAAPALPPGAAPNVEQPVPTSMAEAALAEQNRLIDEKVAVSFQKPKTARKIAKDMERWAKKMNHATEARKVAVKQAQVELRLLAQKEEELRKQILQEVQTVGSAALPIIPALTAKDNIRSLFVPDNDEEGSVLKLGAALTITPSLKPKASAKVIAAELPEDDDFVDESKFVDLSKMACLLCKRQFPSKDVLTKHLQMSQLHKDNLEKYKMTKGGA